MVGVGLGEKHFKTEPRNSQQHKNAQNWRENMIHPETQKEIIMHVEKVRG